jgi:hypothetical protein
MDNVSDWQHPFVDVFKRYNTFDAPKSYKGSVTIVHVFIHFHPRTQPSPEKPSNSQAQSFPTTP